MDIQINNTCPSKRESNLTFNFQSSLDKTKYCLSSSKHHSFITCDNLTYGIINYLIKLKHFFLYDIGVHYNIDGYLLCGTRNLSLSTKKEVYGNLF